MEQDSSLPLSSPPSPIEFSTLPTISLDSSSSTAVGDQQPPSPSAPSASATPASATAVPGTAWMLEPNIVQLYFDLDGDYKGFIDNLRDKLADNLEHREKVLLPEYTWLVHHPLLPKQDRAYQPARWMHIKLIAGNENVTLAVRDDNLYLIGFMNRRGHWYEFGFNDQLNGHMIPGASFLGCDVQYSQLVLDKEFLESKKAGVQSFMDTMFDGKPNTTSDNLVKGLKSLLERATKDEKKKISEEVGEEVRKKLVGLELGRDSAKYAVGRLSAYDENGQVPPPEEVKRDLAHLIVMVCESARMKPYSDTVRNSWGTGGSIGEALPPGQVGFIWNWKQMSRMLFPEPGKKPNKELKVLGIKKKPDALGVVKLVLNLPKDPMGVAGGDGQPPQTQATPSAGSSTQEPEQELPGQAQPQSTGQPPVRSSAAGYRGKMLAEVFHVRANFHVIGSITVFDGKRGQKIYKQDQGQGYRASTDDSQSQHQSLELTGPYKAISADGCFVLIVDIAATAATYLSGDKSSNLGAAMFWDAYAEDTMYDKVLTHNITTSPGRSIEVTYGVLTNAVEAYVKVMLIGNMIPDWTTANPALVYGKITARIQGMDGADSVLFSREPGEKVEVQHGTVPSLPLSRSIVAVPFGSKMLVTLDLHAGISGMETISFQQASEMDIHDGNIRLGRSNHAIVEVSIHLGAEPGKIYKGGQSEI